MRTMLLLCVAASLAPMTGRQDSPPIGAGFAFFPADNPWNWDISTYAVHPLSDTYVSSIGAGGHLQVDLSFRFNAVSSTTPLKTINFTVYPSDSDPGPGFGTPPGGTTSGSWPIPDGALLELPSDSHLIVVTTDTKKLYEAWQAVPPSSPGAPWSAANGCVFDLNSDALRPDGLTSGDAAGLPILPGLLRWEEVSSGTLHHALRFTVSSSQNTHLYPARHDAGTASASKPPMGLRFRLKSGFVTTGFSAPAQAILNCLKKHGMFVADNGTSWFINGVMDTGWPSTVLDEIKTVPASAMEAIQTVDASGSPIYPSGTSGGGSGSGGVPPAGTGSGTVAPSGGSGGGGGSHCAAAVVPNPTPWCHLTILTVAGLAVLLRKR